MFRFTNQCSSKLLSSSGIQKNKFLMKFINSSNEIQNTSNQNIAGNLEYRIVIIEKQPGHVTWKTCTGKYVNMGESLCDIIKDDNTIKTIKSPTKGVIANRFVEEGARILDNSLICLIKVSDKPERIKSAQQKMAFSELTGIENIYTDDEKSLVRRLQAKNFIPSKTDHGMFSENILRLEKDEVPSENLSRILEERRKELDEKYIPSNVREESSKQAAFEKTVDKFSLTVENVIDKKVNGELYQELINDNSSHFVTKNLQVVNNGIRDKFLVAATDVNMTKAIQYAISEGERHFLKFELKCLIVIGAVHALKKSPQLINKNNESGINIIIGTAVGGKLAFPLIKNVDKMSSSTLKDKMKETKKDLLEGKDVVGLTNGSESIAITNEWDYGSTSAPSCLYLSNHATLALNNITIKPFIRHDFHVIFQPVMSIVLTFNNQKIHGQDALLFLHKIKESTENLQFE